MNISFGKKKSQSQDIDGPPTPDTEATHSPSGRGFSSKFGDYGRSISSMSKKMSSVTSALGMGENEDSDNRKSDSKQAERSREVERLVEHFRLQCPQTHAGLVVAFTSTTLSPLIDPNVKFKWYRMGADMEGFVQIDESSRAWYPPTADDIGMKICANCEDTMDQGYCRYAEAGPVEADPLLCSMVESALENGRYEVKDVSVSLGTKSLSLSEHGFSASAAARGVSSGNITFDMHSEDRPSALSSNAPFVKIPQNITVEVDSSGVFISGVSVSSDEARARKGLLVYPSPDLDVSCTLPASLIIVVPYTKSPGGGHSTPKRVDSGDADPDDGGSEGNDDVKPAFEWVGDTQGGVHECVKEFLETIPPDTTCFKICLACSDRMIRDALVLSCRALAGFNPDVGVRERLQSLPWFSSDGTRRVAEVQSMAGSDLGGRLKQLEDENATLRRQQQELTLQLMEHEQDYGGPEPVIHLTRAASESTLGDGDASGNEDSTSASPKPEEKDEESQNHYQQASNQLKLKNRELEKALQAAKHREIESEKSILDLSTKLKRLHTDAETQQNSNHELLQRVAESHADARAQRNAAEKSQAEAAELRQRLETETAELQRRLETLTSELQDKVQLASLESSQSSELQAALDEKTSTVSQLRDRIMCLQTDVEEAKSLRENAEVALGQCRQELEATQLAAADSVNVIEELRSEVGKLTASNETLSIDLAKVKEERDELETRSIPRQKYEELEALCDTVQGEKNHWQKKAESLAKEVKKVLKESKHTVRGLEIDIDNHRSMCAVR